MYKRQDQNHLCTCSERELARYYSRFSGPLLDRFDLHIQVLPVPRSQITSGGKGEDSYSMRQKVAVAAEIQTERYKDAGIRFNSRLTCLLYTSPAPKEASRKEP